MAFTVKLIHGSSGRRPSLTEQNRGLAVHSGWFPARSQVHVRERTAAGGTKQTVRSKTHIKTRACGIVWNGFPLHKLGGRKGGEGCGKNAEFRVGSPGFKFGPCPSVARGCCKSLNFPCLVSLCTDGGHLGSSAGGHEAQLFI